MSEMDARFQALIDESTPTELKVDPISDLAENMAAKATKDPEPVANTFKVDIARSKDDGIIEAELFVPAGDGPHPGVLWMHGGGYCERGYEHTTYRRVCNTANAVVIAPKYRLAPQHRFPAGPDDCLDTYKWFAKNAKRYNVDTERLFIAGESAGGGLTASLAVRIRDEKIQPVPVGQIPAFPFLDPRANTASYINMGSGKHFITRDALLTMWKAYQSEPEDLNNPIFTVFATNSYTDLPPALIINGCADPLLDDGIIYGAHLKKAGVAVTTVNYQDMPHCFYEWDKLFAGESDQFYGQIATFINVTCARRRWVAKQK